MYVNAISVVMSTGAVFFIQMLHLNDDLTFSTDQLFLALCLYEILNHSVRFDDVMSENANAVI